MIVTVETKNKNLVSARWKEATLSGTEESINEQIRNFEADGYEVKVKGGGPGKPLPVKPSQGKPSIAGTDREDILDGIKQVFYEGTKYSIGNSRNGEVELYRYKKFHKTVPISEIKPVRKGKMGRPTKKALELIKKWAEAKEELHPLNETENGLIKFTSQKFASVSKECPLHIAKRGDIVLSGYFVKTNKLEDSTNCLFFALKDGTRVEMYLCNEKIEEKDFGFSKNNKKYTDSGSLVFGSTYITGLLKVANTWFYKNTGIEPKAAHPEGLKIKGLTKLTFELHKKADLNHKK